MSTFRTVVNKDDEKLKRGGEYFKTMKYLDHKAPLIMTIILHFIVGALPVLMSILLGDMVDVFASENFMDEFTPIICDMAYFVVGMFVASSISFGLRAWCNAQLPRDLRKKVYRNVIEQGIDYFDRTPTGVLIGRLSQDITIIHDVYVEKLLNALQMAGEAIAGVVLAFVSCWRLALIGAAVIVVCMIIYAIGDKIIDKIWITYNESSSAANNKAEEAINGFRTIKSFDNELYEASLYKKQLVEVDKVFFKTGIAQGIKDGLISLLANLMVAAICYFGSDMVMNQMYLGYRSGDIFIVFFSMMMGVFGLTQAIAVSNDMNKTAISAEKIIQLIEMKPKIDRKKGGNIENVKGTIEFKNINAGETVAFVGESGCGKSTTLQLIQRFYEIESGQILIDGKDISELSCVNLRSHISVVPQAPVLFSISILDNIRYSKADATKEEIVKAAQVGNAHNFITDLPKGYKSVVHQTSLSGGQKQRICISRAILANAPILLLDEATAALDTESEQLVHESIEKFRHGKTAILVAHRLATVMNADRILVFQNGHILEEGTHKELLAKGGFYADLVKYQLQ
ncbi:ABC transporter family protein [Histomonas meleagridis]|nr:ABC transporter family protein [Histomonas meleagridis]